LGSMSGRSSAMVCSAHSKHSCPAYRK
jgi:hypothetical protein